MPSLQEILNDPNYVNANEATKEAIFNKYSAQDPNYANANGATQEAIRAKFGVGAAAAASIPTPPQKSPEDVGFFEAIPAAAKRGIESLKEVGTGLGLAGKQITGDTEAVRKVMAQAKEQKPEEKPGMTVTDFERIAAEKGFAAAAKEAPKYIVEQVLQSAPQMAGPIAAGMATSPFLTPVGGALVGMGVYGVQQFGNFLMRQAEEKKDPQELELTKAALTAAGTAPLGYFADRFTLGLSTVGKTAGKEVLTELAKRRAMGEIGAGAVAKEVGKRAAVGATEGIIAEAPTEVLEQAAERYQAGLDLTGKDAVKEYKEAFFGAAAAGAGLGGGARGVETYGEYRGELRGAQPATPPETRRSAFSEATEYEDTGTISGGGEPSVPVPGEQGGAEPGVEGPAAGGVGGAELSASGIAVREEALDNQLNELRNEQAKIAAFDPNDPRIGDLEETIKELQAERKERAFNLPGQELSGVELYKAMALHLYDTGKMTLEPSDWAMGKQRPEGLTHEQWFRKTLEESPGVASAFLTNATTKELQEAKEAVQPKPSTPVQEGFDFGSEEPGKEPERIIKSSEPAEFSLTAPEGKVAEAEGIEAIPEPEKAKMMLVGDRTNPTKPLTSFFNSLKPSTANPAEAVKYRAAVNNFLDDVAEFVGARGPKEVSRFKEKGAPTPVPEKGPDVSAPLTGPELDSRMAFLNNFFDNLSIAPKDKEALTSSMSQRFAGMDAKQQADALGSFTNVPQLNTRRGIEDLQTKFKEALTKFERKRIGEEETALPYKLTDELADFDPFTLRAISRALKDLQDMDPKDRTPEDQAAFNYFNDKTGWRYVLAMRSAAFDLGVPKSDFSGVIFKDQNKEQAQLFKKWVEENLPATEYRKFEATEAAYKRQVARADESIKIADQLKKTGGVGKTYSVSIGRAPSGKAAGVQGAGMKRFMTPGPVEKLDPTRFYPMHPAMQEMVANNNANGALAILAQDPGKQASSMMKYTAKYAQRLLDLKLNVSIGVNRQNEMAAYYINKNAGDARTEFVKAIGSYPWGAEFLAANGFDASLNDPASVRKSLQILEALDKDTNPDRQKVLAPIRGQFKDMLKAYQEAVGIIDANGTYLESLNAINLNPDRGGLSNITFLHEMTHAATIYALDPANYNNLTTAQKDAVLELKVLFATAKMKYGQIKKFAPLSNENAYGFTNLQEFVAEAMSNENFQAMLKKIKYEGEKQTLWDKFSNFIAKLFGMDNVLGHTMAKINVILQAPPAFSQEAVAYNQRGRSKKSVLDNTLPSNPGYMGFFESGIFAGRPGWSKVKEGMAGFLDDVKNTTRKYYLGGFTLRQLDDMIGHRLPQFKTFIRKIEEMQDDRNRLLEERKIISTHWEKFKSNNPKAAKTMDKLMIAATLEGKDPAKGKTGIDKLDDAWEAIGPEGQAVYEMVRDFYGRSLKNYIDMIVENKKATLRTVLKETDPQKYAQETKDLEKNPEVKAVRDHFKDLSIEPYFPIRRFGKYSLQLLEGRDKEFYLFESPRQRRLFQKQRVAELEAQLGRPLVQKEIHAYNSVNEMSKKNLEDFTFLEDLKTMVRTTKAEDTTELRKALEDGLEQLYYLILPDKSIRKAFLKRKGTAGMDTDMLRAFQQSSSHMAYQQSRYKHSRELYSAIDTAREKIKETGGEEGTVEYDYLTELYKRLEQAMNPPDTGGVPAVLSNLSFVWYLTSPATAITNLLGVPAVAMPVVAARYGWDKTAAKIGEYTKKFTKTGFKDQEGKVAFPSLGNNPSLFTDVQKRAFDKLIMDGLFDITLSHDAIGQAEGTSPGGIVDTGMRWLSATFHGTEKFNREVVGMAAFDLAYEKAKAVGYTDEAAFKNAIDAAKELTYKAMGDYSTLNKPRWFQYPAAKVLLQFKQFSQQMTVLLARSAYEFIGRKYTPAEIQDIRGKIKDDHRVNKPTLPPLSDAELDVAVQQYIKDVRTEARNRLAGTLGMTAVFAGATGLPMWWVVSTTMNALHAAFGDDDEEWDFDTWFKDWCNNTFGGFVGDSISRGVVSQTLGANVADRLSLNDMWYRDARKSPDTVSAVQNMFINLLGPAAGIFVNAVQAYDQYNQGHIERAFETASPAIIKNTLKGIRLASEGRATTLRGNELVSDITASESAGQLLGFTPERVAQRQKANIERKTAEQNILRKRKALLDAFFMSVDTQDDDMTERVLEKIGRFNTAHGGVAIDGGLLQQSVETRYKQRAMADAMGGMAINKNLISELEGMGDYGIPD